MDIQIAKTIIAEWLEERQLPSMVERNAPKVNFNKLSEIMAIAGPRRAGKTFLMYQWIKHLLDTGVQKKEILLVDFEDFRLTSFSSGDIEILLTAFNQLTGHYPVYLFFDEVQHLPDWSRVLRTLHNQGRYRIVVTGSNSEILSREISSELRGRYRDVLLLPFSYSEFLALKGVSWNPRMLLTPARGKLLKVFDDYLMQGGFPEVVQKDTSLERKEILQNYYRTLLYRDLLERHNIQAKYVLESMMNYCLSSFSDLFSISGFSDYLAQSGLPGSKRTVSNYLHYLREAFFLILLEKFDYSPRKRVMNPRKIYLLDTGFISLAVAFSENRGKILENLVAIELFRRREDLYYFKRSHECDFIVQRGIKDQLAIQVCWELNVSSRNREIKGLRDACQSLNIKQAAFLTYNQEGQEEIDGKQIPVIPVWKWLLLPEEEILQSRLGRTKL